MIEAITYRYGHVDWREDIDVGTNRCQESLKNWKLRCPKKIKRFNNRTKYTNPDKLDEIRAEIIRDLNDDWNQAINDPFPKDNDLLKNVYCRGKNSYAESILEGFKFLLENYPEVFIIGQGLWSPWYVGNSMKDLDIMYGKERIIDTPVSENAVTGAAIGASLCGMKPKLFILGWISCFMRWIP